MTAQRTRKALTIDIVVQSKLWRQEPEARATVRRALEAAARLSGYGVHAIVSVLLADDGAVQALNQQWRGQNKPTNVLSFSAPATPAANSISLGDIAIAFETVAREAAKEDKPFLHHLAHLSVHGFLHLRGHDHSADREAEAMESLERKILHALDIPDPYR